MLEIITIFQCTGHESNCDSHCATVKREPHDAQPRKLLTWGELEGACEYWRQSFRVLRSGQRVDALQCSAYMISFLKTAQTGFVAALQKGALALYHPSKDEDLEQHAFVDGDTGLGTEISTLFPWLPWLFIDLSDSEEDSKPVFDLSNDDIALFPCSRPAAASNLRLQLENMLDDTSSGAVFGFVYLENPANSLGHFVSFYAIGKDMRFIDPSRGPHDTFSNGVVPADEMFSEFQQLSDSGFNISFVCCNKRRSTIPSCGGEAKVKEEPGTALLLFGAYADFSSVVPSKWTSSADTTFVDAIFLRPTERSFLKDEIKGTVVIITVAEAGAVGLHAVAEAGAVGVIVVSPDEELKMSLPYKSLGLGDATAYKSDVPVLMITCSDAERLGENGSALIRDNAGRS